MAETDITQLSSNVKTLNSTVTTNSDVLKQHTSVLGKLASELRAINKPAIKKESAEDFISEELTNLSDMVKKFSNKFKNPTEMFKSITTGISTELSENFSPLSSTIGDIKKTFGSMMFLQKKRDERDAEFQEDQLGIEQKNPLEDLKESFQKIPDAITESMRNVTKSLDKMMKSAVDGFMKFLIGGLGILMAALGTGLLFKGLFDDGPFKGLMKVLGKLLISAGTKLFLNTFKIFKPFFNFIEHIFQDLIGNGIKFLTSGIVKTVGKLVPGFGKSFLAKALMTFGKFAVKFARRIPVIGTLIGIGFAISRFAKGDVIGGIIDLASALVGLAAIFPPFAPFALPISIALDVLNAGLDIASGGDKKKKMNIVGSALASVGKFLLKVGKFLPVIGGIIKIGESIFMITKGNTKEGIKGLIIGMIGLAPIPALVPFLEFLDAKTKEDKNAPPKKGFAGMIDKFGKFVIDIAKNLPIIGGAIRIGESIFGFLNGKLSPIEALKGIADGIFWLTPIPALMTFIEFIGNKVAPKQTASVKSGINTFFKNIIDGIKNAFLKMPLMQKIFKIGEAFSNVFTGSDKGKAIAGLFNSIADIIPIPGVKELATFLGGKASEAVALIKQKNEKEGKNIIQSIFEAIGEKIKEIMGALKDFIFGFFENVGKKIEVIKNTKNLTLLGASDEEINKIYEEQGLGIKEGKEKILPATSTKTKMQTEALQKTNDITKEKTEKATIMLAAKTTAATADTAESSRKSVSLLEKMVSKLDNINSSSPSTSGATSPRFAQ